MSAAPSFDDRTLDLLALDATEGLEATETAELERLAPEGDIDALRRGASLDLAAAALHLALLPVDAASPLPSSLERRLRDSGRRFAKERSGILARIGPSRSSPSRSTPAWLPWSMAACMAIATAWAFLRPVPGQGMIASIANAPDVVEVAWSPWDSPQVTGVEGDVRWSQSLQRGVMRFRGLPANDPASTQYQLWIIDSRGMGQRVSGAVFNASGNGQIEVPVEPLIPVRDVAAFAVTVEQPGGTWVSDMSRRVVIASRR